MKKNLLSIVTNLLKYKLDILFLICIIVYLTILILNFNFYPLIANSDVIQFLMDGRTYHSLELPANIHASPLYPIVITFVSYLFKDHFLLYEVAAARFINIVSILGSLGLLYLFAKKQSNALIALAVCILAMLHPWTFMMGIGDYSESSYTFLVLLSLYSLVKLKRISLAFFIAGISFLVRNEGILLFLSLFLVEVHSSRINVHELLARFKKTVLLPGFLIGSAIITGWLIILFANNLHSSIYQLQYSDNLRFGYYFFYEIVERKNELPELRFISNYPKFIFAYADYRPTSYSDPYLWIGVATSLILIIFYFRVKNQLVRAISLYIVMYLFLHMAFPAYPLRYFFPLLFITYLLLLAMLKSSFDYLQSKGIKKNRLIVIPISLYLLMNYFLIHNFTANIEPQRKYYESYEKIAIWIKNSIMSSKNSSYTLYMQYPFLKYYLTGEESSNSKRHQWTKDSHGDHYLSYFNPDTNTKIRFIDTDQLKSKNCMNILCINERYRVDDSNSLFIHAKIEPEETMLFYEENLDEIGEKPDLDSPDADVRFFTFKNQKLSE